MCRVIPVWLYCFSQFLAKVWATNQKRNCKKEEETEVCLEIKEDNTRFGQNKPILSSTYIEETHIQYIFQKKHICDESKVFLISEVWYGNI